MIYTMMQACELTGMTYQGLKFYCNEGLVPNVKRDNINRRIFDERDIAWIKSLTCLKNCGMTLQENISGLMASIEYIDSKQKFYDEVLSGEREYFSNLLPCSCQNQKSESRQH